MVLLINTHSSASLCSPPVSQASKFALVKLIEHLSCSCFPVNFFVQHCEYFERLSETKKGHNVTSSTHESITKEFLTD